MTGNPRMTGDPQAPRHHQPPGESGPGDPGVPAWLAEALDLPYFDVIDTRSAQGRLDDRPKRVEMRDLILFHGHPCDGLLRGAYAMRALADVAFSSGPLDRSDMLVVSKNSPCLGDVAAYLTGGRARFGTHRLDDTLGVGFIVKVLSTGKAWEVREEPGFFPQLVTAWEAALLDDSPAVASDKPEFVAVNEAAQWNWVRTSLLPSRPADHYQVRVIEGVDLPAPLHVARRTDVVNRALSPSRLFASPYEAEAAPPLAPSLVAGASSFEQRYLKGPG